MANQRGQKGQEREKKRKEKLTSNVNVLLLLIVWSLMTPTSVSLFWKSPVCVYSRH